MSEVTDLVVIEKSNAMTVFKSADQIEDILQKVEREVMSFVPDVSTAKGRKEIASLAYRVAQTKTYLDGLGKDLVAELKEIPKLIDGNRKTVRDRLDALKEKARQPLTDYEAEQERLKKEEEERIAAEAYSKMRDEADRMNAEFDIAKAEALKIKFEADHELALLMNDAFDREQAEKKAEAERQRIAHEEELKRRAEEKARAEAEAKARDEIEAAEREKQAAIEDARRKAQEEVDHIRREAEVKEQARLAEEKRIRDEEERRAQDVAHRKEVNNKILADLIKAGASEDVAKKIITAVVKGEVFATRITY